MEADEMNYEAMLGVQGAEMFVDAMVAVTMDAEGKKLEHKKKKHKQK